MHPQTRILCIEDTPEIREDLALELRDANYQVIEAETGLQALDLLERHPPDLVICDIMLPDIDGISVLAAIRSSAVSDVPVIIVSAFCDSRLRDQAAAYGIEKFIVKPVDYDDLLVTINDVFHSQQAGGPKAETCSGPNSQLRSPLINP